MAPGQRSRRGILEAEGQTLRSHLRCFTAGDLGWVRLQLRDELVRFGVEVRRHVTFHTTGELSRFLWEGFRVSRELLVPGRFFRLTHFFRIPLSVDFRRDFEGRVFPAQRFTGQCNFRVAQRCAVGVVSARFVGEPKPMMVLHISRDGLSVTARASSTARLIESASWPSTPRTTCQP